MTVAMCPPATRGVSAWQAIISLGRAEATSTVVVVRGELDVSTSARLSNVVSGLSSAHENDVIVDLTGATFIDVASARKLAALGNLLAQAGRSLTLRSPSSPVKKMMIWIGLRDLIQENSELLSPDAV